MTRRKTREVLVGGVGIGGSNPIRIQSMTTSATQDVAGTVEQVMRLADAGCDIARVTVQGMREAQCCEAIKSTLVQRGYKIPLVADIHFYPPAALRVADFVDKVRINPGNFADVRATFQRREYDDATYLAELERVEATFSPLVQKCKRLGRALRIGTNHGSLSDRIMNRYGDTPLGMVESALEYAHICCKLQMHDLVFSMKASNPLIMIEAYRLLVERMDQLGWAYPLHLGVTEAGEGNEGRIKSAMGIATLLGEGIGDTVRVSLTEDPWEEVPVCRQLIEASARSPAAFAGRRRECLLPQRSWNILASDTLILDKTQMAQADGVFVEQIPNRPEEQHAALALAKRGVKIFTRNPTSPDMLRVDEEGRGDALIVRSASHEACVKVRSTSPRWIFFAPATERRASTQRFAEWLRREHLSLPLILHFDASQDSLMRTAVECGPLLADRYAAGVCIQSPHPSLGAQIMQAARLKTVATEYISCPGCGRTLFNLQEVTKRIRAKTGHLAGVRIAVMGCIVNGPGEMADADFGYVGSKAGKVDLYEGKICVQKQVDEAQADESLVALIKARGRWVDP